MNPNQYHLDIPTLSDIMGLYHFWRYPTILDIICIKDDVFKSAFVPTSLSHRLSIYPCLHFQWPMV